MIRLGLTTRIKNPQKLNERKPKRRKRFCVNFVGNVKVIYHYVHKEEDNLPKKVAI